MRRASDTTSGAAESYADVVRQRPAAGGPRTRLRLLATFGGRMHSSDWSRLLTERQREVLSIVVESKMDLNRRPNASTTEVAEELGLSEYTTVNGLRVLMAVQLITKQRGPAVRRGVPPYVYRPTAHGEDLAVRFPAEATA